MTPENRAPKTFLVNRRFQYFVIGLNVLTAIIIILVFFVADRYLMRQSLQQAEFLGLPVDHPHLVILRKYREMTGKIFWLISITSMTLLPTIGLIITHRAAGPLYRLCQHLNALADGKNVGPLKFRKDDFFQEVVEPFNRMLERFNKKS